ncbi:MAG: hypothetical protein ACI8VC_000979 [Candidatus Endobugula sp.]|jgi:hypothetical protein
MSAVDAANKGAGTREVAEATTHNHHKKLYKDCCVAELIIAPPAFPHTQYNIHKRDQILNAVY